MNELSDHSFFQDVKQILHQARQYYLETCAKENWSSRVLERQIQAHTYQRLLSTQQLPVAASSSAPTAREYLLSQLKDPYVLKCFVVIDLKTDKLTHQDIGQMDMYIRMFDDLKRAQDDNPSIGIILCADKDEIMVQYSVLKESEQLFASKYRLHLPTEAELIAELEREQARLEMKKGAKA